MQPGSHAPKTHFPLHSGATRESSARICIAIYVRDLSDLETHFFTNIPAEMLVPSMTSARASVGAAVATENMHKNMLKSMVDFEIVVFMIEVKSCVGC